MAIPRDLTEEEQVQSMVDEVMDRFGRIDILVNNAGGYPKDLNFYQTIKTLCNALEVVEKDGTIILVTRSQEGFGNADTERQIAGFSTMLEREKDLRENFSIGAFIGYLFAESAEKYHMIVVTGMDQAAFGSAKIHAVKTLDEALSYAQEQLEQLMA